MAAQRTATATWRESGEAALLERIELLESEVRELRAERELLETELTIAKSWVKGIAEWVEENVPPVGAAAVEEARLGQKDAVIWLPAPTSESPLEWRVIGAAVALVALPWLLVVLIVYGVIALF